MRHPHVRVYANDHAEATDLLQDYPCQDIADAKLRIQEFIREYVDRIGADESSGVDVAFEGARVVTLRPQNCTLAPRYLTVHFCEQPHECAPS
jgi:hypothetical protein